jgi:hypothetical protein
LLTLMLTKCIKSMSEPIHILSLGAGVQSSTLALMAAKREVTPMPTAAIFADTQAEPKSVYTWLDWLEKQLPYPVYRVTAGNLAEKSLILATSKVTGKLYSKASIPAYVKQSDGSNAGLLGRKCTYDHKLMPMFKKMKELAQIKHGQKTVSIISWIGISLDEVSRMKPSHLKWATNRYPLIELEMSRHDCLRWMESNGYPIPPRSACTFCPFHSDAEWRRLKNENPDEFQKAVVFEKELQAKIAQVSRIDGVPYLHNSFKPLGEIDFSEDSKQGNFHFHNECEGMCGV